MPTYQDDVSRVTSARQRQAALNAEAGQLEAGAMTFGDEVMGKIREARASRGMSQLQQGIGTTTGQLASDPQRIYNYAGADVRPSTVDAFTSKARASNLSTLASQDAMTADIGQTIEEALGAGSNRLLAQAASKKAEAEKAKQESDALMEEIKMRMEQEKTKIGGETYDFTLPNGQVLKGLSATQYADIYGKYSSGGEADKSGAERQVVTGVIDQLYDKYYGEEGTDDDLAKGRIGGAITGIKSAAGKAPTAKRYNELRNGVTTMLKSLVGESGVLTDRDKEDLKGLLPKTNATPTEAEDAWKDIYKFIDNKYGGSSGWSIVEEV